ncbi:ZIP family metal transporter [Aestuariibius sp. 2305UL40-4]|uniref:ZIP family metal transporter n=1 Tax=Aestuariibius violaceus TaxID=3234132 RepID=UPI00345E83AF
MIATIAVLGAVSAALVLGAVLGLSGLLRDRTEGFLVAVAGGALIVSLMLELVQPSVETTSLGLTLIFLVTGALIFTAVDYWVDEVWGAENGSGMLVAVTLDGIPENVALGALLVSAGPMEAAALAGSILLSNLPEASAGARRMQDSGLSRGAAFGVWAAAAGLLAAAAILGNLLLDGVSEQVLAAVRSFAAGSVIAALATEIFPSAFRRSAHYSGIAVAIGLALAMMLHEAG